MNKLYIFLFLVTTTQIHCSNRRNNYYDNANDHGDLDERDAQRACNLQAEQERNRNQAQIQQTANAVTRALQPWFEWLEKQNANRDKQLEIRLARIEQKLSMPTMVDREQQTSPLPQHNKN